MRAALPAACLLALAPAAGAVDGVIEINQARAEAGGVTTTDIPGFPVTIGLPGSYRLTSNLDVTRMLPPENATAIRIESSNVTLDLNGFGVFGPATCTSISPIICTPAGTGDLVRVTSDRVVVRNGSVRGAGNIGVRLDSPLGTAEGLTVSNCASHGISGQTDSRIVQNIVGHNTGIGIQSGGLIQGNVVRANAGNGISSLPGGQVSDNIVDGNVGVGIANAELAMRNSVRGNGGLGISNAAAFGHNVIRNNNVVIGNPAQTSGGIEIAPNVCGNDTICP